MSLLASVALLRVHVLVVALPGQPALALRAEAAVRARGWAVVQEPADTDLLLVCGTAVPEMAAAIDSVWWRVPAPRARRTVRSAEELPDALDSAARVLADRALQRRARADAGPAPEPPEPGRLGPIGAHWPAGLVVDAAAGQDGTIAAVGVRRIAAGGSDEVVPDRDLALAVAAAARLLRLARWEPLALSLDRTVDLALAGAPAERVRRRLRRVAARVDRSSTLRWSLAGEAGGAEARSRALALLAAAIAGTPVPPARRDLVRRLPDAVPMLVAATEPPDA